MATRVAEWLNELLQARDAGLRRNARRAPQLVLLKHQVVEEAFQETWIRVLRSGGGALTLRFATDSKLVIGSDWIGQ